MERNIEFELRGLGPFFAHVLLKLGIFNAKQKFSRQISSELLFTAKILQESSILLLPTWGTSLIKLNPKMQNFKLILNLNCEQRKDRTI